MISPKTGVTSKGKWFLFNVTDDFHFIFIKCWKKYLSKNIVLKAINEAKRTRKTIEIEAEDKSWPLIFALPTAPLKFKEQDSMTDNFLIFGPYKRNDESNLLLLRSEKEGKKSKLQPNEKQMKTRCIW
jgi:hypothetical protein